VLSWFYRAYGLSLAANRQIPNLLAVSSADAPRERIDLQIWFNWLPPWLMEVLGSPRTIRYVSRYLNDAGQPVLTVWLVGGGAYYLFRYAEGIDYILSRDGARLWIRASDAVAESDILSYLLGPVMGLVLRVRGVVCLHASAVAVNRRAVVFVGDNGAGKSTTAIAMGRLGYAVLSDDIVPICYNAGVAFAQPGYPRVRLRQRSLPMLSDLNPDLPPLPKVKGEGRLHFPLTTDGYQFQSDPLPIGAIYLLAARSVDAHAPRVESVSPQSGIMGLLANAYANRFLDKPMRAHEFRELGHLVNQIGVRKVYPHREPSRLAMLCKVILEDISSQAARAQAV
jgi:hypothetical protein